MRSPLSEREDDACRDLIANGEAALQFIAGMTFETFAVDQRTNDAVVRCLESISEARRRLGLEMQARDDEIPWRDIADAGNFHRHSYHRVALDIVWRTVHDPLIRIIAVCRAELDPSLDP